MGIEIERKFTVVGDAWRASIDESIRMAQGYINDHAAVANGAQQASVRVRIAGDRAFLNLKSREAGPSRQEFDYSIPVTDAAALLKLCVGGLIDKVRHHVRVDGWLFEIDEFAGDNAGLIVAEIELPDAQADFPRPSWLGLEVTDHVRYYNLALAARPYCRWNGEEKL